MVHVYINFVMTLFHSVYTINGQKVAKKLSQQIAKETKVVNELVLKYNNCSNDPTDNISLSDALSASAVGDRLEQVGITSSNRLSCGRKRELIDAYLLLIRSKEELIMLEEDAKNCVEYYKEREEAIMQEMNTVSYEMARDPYSRGKRAMLNNLLKDNHRLLSRSQHTLTVNLMITNDSTLPAAVPTYSDTDSSDDDDDYDCAI